MWKTEKSFKQSIDRYIDHCKSENRLPNIAGFVVYMHQFETPISRTQVYAYKDVYPDTYKYLEELLEEEALNNTTLKDAMKIFYLKNKCGYVDKQEVKQDVSMSVEDYFKDNKIEL